MIRLLQSVLLALCLLLLAPPLGASTNAAGGLMVKSRNALPNIIFLSIDDVGREAYGALNSPFKMTGTSQTWSDGTSYLPITAADTPGMNRLLANGISFEGLWTGKVCAASRLMLKHGVRHHGNNPNPYGTDDTTKRQIQDATNEAYRIFGAGKSQLGEGGTIIGNNASPVTDGECVLGTGGGPVVNYRTGETGLGYNEPWEYSYRYATCEADQTDAVYGTYAPSNPNLSSDNLIHMDEAMTDQALDFIRDDAFGGGDPKLLWDNHYAKPFVVAIGYHNNHGDSWQDLSNYAVGDRTDGNRVIIDATIQGHEDYQTRIDAGQNVFINNGYPNLGGTTDICPGFPTGNSEDLSDVKLDWDSYHSCMNTLSIFIDYQIVRFLDVLGDAGLNNTLFIFTGDNGSLGPDLINRAGLNKGVDDYGNATTGDIDGSSTCRSTGGGGYCGKATQSETGINTPFIMAGGPVSNANKGTSSKLRFNNTDVAETIIQTVSANASSYTPDGRDFTDVYTNDCGAGSCDTLTGFEITLSQGGWENITPGGGGAQVDTPNRDEVSAVQELTGGSIYRIMRFPALSQDECDWVQDLESATPNANLRNLVQDGINNGDALDLAYAALDAALVSDGPHDEGGSGCDPSP